MTVAVDVRVEWDMVSCEYYLGRREEGGRQERKKREKKGGGGRIST